MPTRHHKKLVEPVIAVHGGAGRISPDVLQERRNEYETGLKRAIAAGQRVLTRGGSACDAVVQSVMSLEDNPLFNAGKGSVMCADGSIKLSASMMDGATERCGAIAGVERIRNPIQGAYTMLDHQHVLLIGEDAEHWIAENNLKREAPSYYATERRRKQWLRLRTARSRSTTSSNDGNTVGAVARDQDGHLAAATSTGGVVYQHPGRVGDSPVIGAGTWADDRTCAVSATGEGDFFFRNAFARRVADLIELAGYPLERACIVGLQEVRKLGGKGGCIAVDAAGNLSMPSNTRTMSRGFARGGGKAQLAIESSKSGEVSRKIDSGDLFAVKSKA